MAPTPRLRRWQVPADAERLVVALSVIVGIVACIAIALAVFTVVKIRETEDGIRRAQDKSTTQQAELERNVAAIKREGAERKDQTCVLFERAHRADVKQLRQTYDFIEHPIPSLAGLRKVVIATLGQTERNARLSRPPRYCDPASVGLAAPPPVLPHRPKGLRAGTH